MRPAIHSLFLFLLLLAAGCSTDSERNTANVPAAAPAAEDVAGYKTERAAIEQFFDRMGEPGPADWLATHNEPGQTLAEYLASKPGRPSAANKKLYILPLGEFSDSEREIVEAASSYLAVFFGIPVEMLPARPLVVTHPNVRQNRFTRTRQIKTGYLLDRVLKPLFPRDAAALIAFVRDDLYPDESMNYVFGQASLDDHVGVWSLSRLDDQANRITSLRRTLKIAAHETGHMFGIRHCAKYECVMSGTNHLGETDRRPIDACPECSAKLWWLSDADIVDRYDRLRDFARKYGLSKEAEEFQRKASAVRAVYGERRK